MANTKEWYSSQLNTNKWHRVRDAVKIRDNYTCQECGDSESLLEVHHVQYLKGKKPFESPMEDLITLCDKCHEAKHVVIPTLEEMLLTRSRMIELINDPESTTHAKYVRQLAIIGLESEIEKLYPGTLKRVA